MYQQEEQLTEQEIVNKTLKEWDNEYNPISQKGYDEEELIINCDFCRIEMDVEFSSYVCRKCGFMLDVQVFEEDSCNYQEMTKIDKSYSREKYLKKCLNKMKILLSDSDILLIIEAFKKFIKNLLNKFKIKKIPLHKFIILEIAKRNNMHQLVDLLKNEKFPSYYHNYLELFD